MTICTKNPSKTMGSRPYRLVFWPNIPNNKPPVKETRKTVVIIYATSNCKHSFYFLSIFIQFLSSITQNINSGLGNAYRWPSNLIPTPYYLPKTYYPEVMSNEVVFVLL